MSKLDLTYALISICLVVGLYMAFRNYRAQHKKLQALERSCQLHDNAASPCRSAAIIAQATATPWLWHQRPLALGLYSCAAAGTAQEVSACLEGIVFESSLQAVYVGEHQDVVAAQLLQRGIKSGHDPRGRVAMPANIEELRRLFAEGKLKTPWIVCDTPEWAEALRNLKKSYTCGVLVYGSPEPPQEYSELKIKD